MKTGDVKDNGRWCEACNQFHGILYQCEKYPIELLDELERKSEKYIANLRSREWCKKQMEKTGIDAIGIEIFRAMAGIEVGDWTK